MNTKREFVNIRDIRGGPGCVGVGRSVPVYPGREHLMSGLFLPSSVFLRALCASAVRSFLFLLFAFNQDSLSLCSLRSPW